MTTNTTSAPKDIKFLVMFNYTSCHKRTRHRSHIGPFILAHKLKLALAKSIFERLTHVLWKMSYSKSSLLNCFAYEA
ncbi:hypothetical protein BpHYR1_049653 [Brachionus plicatilis]|uniref:Uncharacterized protein n=1 Tax=Brachionus plicatilis TaxID=10195 RepID=A0A3M7R594_BRAPC|nr:hypothetical protein BpHYR1_049653 [Brachionus plicatilis]